MKRRLFTALISFVCCLALFFSLVQNGKGTTVEDAGVFTLAVAASVEEKGADSQEAKEVGTAPVETVSEDLTVPEAEQEEEPAMELQDADPIETESAEEEKSVTFDDVEESVYTTTCVNVRNGPGMEFEKIDMYYSGHAVKRTGIGDNGWSRIDYNGQVAYMHSDYLSTVAPEEVQRPVYDETAGNVVFEEVNETVYATTGVNVRSGPGTEYEKLGAYNCGKQVVRTGIGDNGWSRIDYNGQVAYMHSDYLSYEKVAPPKGKLGTAGRLSIPSVGVDVALYYCSSSAEYVYDQQRIVDNADSAAYLPQDSIGGVLIADHKHQGFNAMKASVPYETEAYIDFGSYTQKYICIGIGLGKNLGYDLVDWDGVSLNYGHIRGGLAMYTCNENSTNITISYWEPV